MPKEGNKDLFLLIRSLSKSEKAYIRKSAEQHVIGEKNNYLRLFDAIERQETYDEKKLLREEKYIRQLPFLKNYLFNFILKGLQAYHAESKAEHQVMNMSIQAGLLYERGLHEACEKMIAKAKALCAKHEYFLDAARLMRLERRLNHFNGKFRDDGTRSALHAELIEQLELEKNAAAYVDIQNEMLAMIHRVIIGASEKKALPEHPLLKDEKQARSLVAKIARSNTLAAQARFTDDWEGNYRHMKRTMELVKEQYAATEDVVAYLHGLNNFFLACYTIERFDECEQLLTELEGLQAKNPKEEVEIFGRLASMRLLLCERKRTYREGAEFIERMLPVFRRTEKHLAPLYRSNIIFSALRVTFMSKCFKQTLYWMRLFLDKESKAERSDRQLDAAVLNLMLHYELNDREILPHLLKSAQRMHGKALTNGCVEGIMIGCFRNLLRKNSDERAVMQEAKRKIGEARMHLNAEAFQTLLDYEGWLEEKISKLSAGRTRTAAKISTPASAARR